MFVDCNMAGETRHKYFSAISSFIKVVKKSKYKDTGHGHLMSGLESVLN